MATPLKSQQSIDFPEDAIVKHVSNPVTPGAPPRLYAGLLKRVDSKSSIPSSIAMSKSVQIHPEDENDNAVRVSASFRKRLAEQVDQLRQGFMDVHAGQVI